MSAPTRLLVAGILAALTVVGVARVAGVEHEIRQPLPPVGEARYKHPDPYLEEP